MFIPLIFRPPLLNLYFLSDQNGKQFHPQGKEKECHVVHVGRRIMDLVVPQPSNDTSKPFTVATQREYAHFANDNLPA